VDPLDGLSLAVAAAGPAVYLAAGVAVMLAVAIEVRRRLRRDPGRGS
jgi:hypothetical protein